MNKIFIWKIAQLKVFLKYLVPIHKSDHLPKWDFKRSGDMTSSYVDT